MTSLVIEVLDEYHRDGKHTRDAREPSVRSQHMIHYCHHHQNYKIVEQERNLLVQVIGDLK